MLSSVIFRKIRERLCEAKSEGILHMGNFIYGESLVYGRQVFPTRLLNRRRPYGRQVFHTRLLNRRRPYGRQVFPTRLLNIHDQVHQIYIYSFLKIIYIGLS